MIRVIEKGRAVGKIFAPTSKSVAHRMLICAALCREEESIIRGITSCEDVLATIDCLRTLGAKIEYSDGCARVVGIDPSKSIAQSYLLCRESGSTLRFMIPLLWLSGERYQLTGSERLFARSMSVYEEIAEKSGFLFEKTSGKIITKGRLSAGIYNLPGNVSSQFITGLLFALSTLDSDSEIRITTEIESLSYINITIDVMASFGVKVNWKDKHTLYIQGGQKYSARDLTVEGDWSNAAFLDALNLVGGDVRLLGMNDNSSQGDKVYKDFYRQLTEGFSEIDLTLYPDLGPILFTLATINHGGRFVGVRRLRDKESDRISAMKTELSKFGAEIIEEENSVTINNRPLHAPGERLFGHNDHRIVMSLSVISSLFGGEIEGAHAVSKSYPAFFEDLATLGIQSYEID